MSPLNWIKLAVAIAKPIAGALVDAFRKHPEDEPIPRIKSRKDPKK